MKKIVVKRSDGGVSIIIPTNEATPKLLVSAALAVEGYVSHREIDDDKLPADRLFRNAWTDDFDTDTVDEHPDKCRTIIRETRNKKLQELDSKAFSESRKPNGDITSIDLKAQRLRDIPQHPDFNSNDISKLKQLLISVNNE